MIYLDASIVLAYYLSETYSEQAQAVYRDSPQLYLSELVELETFSTLSRLVRVGSIELEEARRTARLFTNHVESGLYNRVHLHAGHYRVARDYIGRFDLPLKAPDGLHLAVAAAEGLRLVTADQQLARNAENLGIEAELIRP